MLGYVPDLPATSLSELINSCITQTGSNLCFNMADSSGTLRRLGIAHILVGILLVSLGIADRFEGFVWTGDLYFGIWIGTWVSFPHCYHGFARMSDGNYCFS